MVLDLGKRYTFAGHEYEFCRSGCHWDSCEDGIPCFSVDEFRFFGNAGLVTEVREPYKTTNQAPNIYQPEVAPRGRHWMYVDAEFVELYRKGADVLVTFEEIITQEGDKP